MILEVLKFPDPRLRETSKEVTKFDADLKQLVSDMLETMYAERGIGLAAPQVAELKRLLIVDTRPKAEKGRYENDDQTDLEKKITQPLVVINPKIIKGEGTTTFDEGCLSVPSFYETVERFETITLEYNDVDGKKQKLVTDGLLSICLQHEMDHLEGTLFIDHIGPVKSARIKNQIKKHGYPEKKNNNEDDESSEM